MSSDTDPGPIRAPSESVVTHVGAPAPAGAGESAAPTAAQAPPAPAQALSSSPAAPAPDPAWVRFAFAGVVAFAAVLYFWNLDLSGWANTYYSAAAQAASQSWSAWFFGSFDSANFITVDKPPLSTMLMGLSVRLLGLSSWSILLPEALCGVATVAVLFVVVRRQLGPVAAVIAGLVAALTPAAVLMFRYNNPDALLTLLMVLAAWALVRGLESDRLRWAVLSAVLVGFAFNAKSLQAFLVLPPFALTWLVAAQGSLRRRLAGLLAAGVAALVSSGWWVVLVDLLPKESRPYIGGSDGNSALELVFGYNGLGRIFGQGAALPGGAGGGGAPGGGAGPSFSGTPGLLRLFNSDLGGQVAWLIPLALLGLAAGLLLRGRRPRTDARRAAYILWGGWFAVHAIVFSFMSGIIHSYYAVVMAPAIGALVGGGVVDLWRLRARFRLGGLPLAAGIAVTAWLGWELLNRTPAFVPGLATSVLLAGIAAAVVVALPRLAGRRVLETLTGGALALGLVALLAGPTAYAAATMQTAYSGGDPAAGPAVARSRPGGFVGGGFLDGPRQGGAPGGPSGVPPNGLPGGPSRVPPGGFPGGTVPGALPSGGPNPNPGDLQGGTRGIGVAAVSAAVIDHLLANRGNATWIVAANGSQEAGALQLAAGQPVMAMGGFNGSDPAPTLDQVKGYVASGRLRFVITSGGVGGPPGGAQRNASIGVWVTNACMAVSIAGTSISSLYDCAGAATR